jgi:hypothetical protein
MLSHQEIVAIWGEANVRTVSATVLDTRPLPPEAKLVLGVVGVPHKPDLFGITLLDEESLHLPRIIFPDSPDQWFRIGLIWRVERQICVHSATGEVRCLVRSHVGEPFLMNSSLGALVEFLSVFRQSWVRMSGYHGVGPKRWREISTAAAIPVEYAWRQIDGKAVEPDTYWSTILEEVKAGILS